MNNQNQLVEYTKKPINLLTKEQLDKCLEYTEDKQPFLDIMGSIEYIKITYLKQEIPPFSDNFPYYVNKYRVSIKNKNGNKFNSVFYSSYNDTINHILPSLYDILTVIASEGTMETNTLQDFCNELGYDINEPKITRTYKALLKYQKNLEKVFDIDDLYLFPH